MKYTLQKLWFLVKDYETIPVNKARVPIIWGDWGMNSPG
jgi:hypothetical protein